jgi:hypothetical protein
MWGTHQLEQRWHGGREILHGNGLYTMTDHVNRRNLIKGQVMGNAIEGWIYQPKGPLDLPYFL